MRHRCCPTCEAALAAPLPVRTPVIVQRNTKRWPRAGTWKRYDGQTGFIDIVNREPSCIEYGVTLASKTSWFAPHEVTVRP